MNNDLARYLPSLWKRPFLRACGGRILCLISPMARAAGPHLRTKTPYTRIREAAATRKWHDSAMKSVFIACGVFAVGVAILSVVPDADLLPSGVRAVLDDVATAW
jgi:hypothetical protein